VNAELARRLSIVLLAMMAAGLLAGWFLYRRSSTEIEGRHPVAGNPFRLAPALKFGAVFAAIMFVSKAAAVEFGGQGVYWASAAGGTVDADAVSVSVASLLAGGTISAVTATPGVGSGAGEGKSSRMAELCFRFLAGRGVVVK